MLCYLLSESGNGTRSKVVRAAYASQEDAERQADHDIATNAKKPIRIEDESGAVLKNYAE